MRSPVGAERAAKAEEIGVELQEARHVGRFQRTGQPDEQAVLASRLHEGRQSGDIGVHQEPARALAGGVDHQPGKTRRGDRRDELGEIAVAVGEDDADEARPDRDAGQDAQHVGPVVAGKQADLDVVDPRRCDLPDCRRDDIRLHGKVAGHRAHRPAALDRGDRGGDPRRRQGAEHAGRRILQVDDIGAAGDGDFRFVRAGHAGEHHGHAEDPIVRAEAA